MARTGPLESRAVADAPIGKRYPPFEYEVGREKIREYANAVGETNPVHHDLEAARAAGFADVVAPPMFCVVYCAPARWARRSSTPRWASTSMLMVHGEPGVRVGASRSCAGDEITTTVTAQGHLRARTGMGFYVFESSLDQPGRATTVSRGTWTNIVRGADGMTRARAGRRSRS